MIDAVAAIGRGEDCLEGIPFALDLVCNRSFVSSRLRVIQAK